MLSRPGIMTTQVRAAMGGGEGIGEVSRALLCVVKRKTESARRKLIRLSGLSTTKPWNPLTPSTLLVELNPPVGAGLQAIGAVGLPTMQDTCALKSLSVQE